MNGWVLERIPVKKNASFNNYYTVRLILIKNGWVKLYAYSRKKLKEHLDNRRITNLEYVEGLELAQNNIEVSQ